MARIKRTPLARRDLKEIGRYLARESQSLDVARRFLDAIGRKCELYARDPELAEACPDLGQNIRRFAVGNYLVFCRPVRDGIEVLRVLHGSRDIPRAWRELR